MNKVLLWIPQRDKVIVISWVKIKDEPQFKYGFGDLINGTEAAQMMVGDRRPVNGGSHYPQLISLQSKRFSGSDINVVYNMC